MKIDGRRGFPAEPRRQGNCFARHSPQPSPALRAGGAGRRRRVGPARAGARPRQRHDGRPRTAAAAIERDRSSHWLAPALINGVGALVTFAVLVVIAVTKFTHGAWAVVVLIPLVVLLFRTISRHYRLVAAQLSLDGVKPLPQMRHRVIVPVSGIHRGVLPALQYARSLGREGGTHVTAVYVEINPQSTQEMKESWERWGQGIPLEVLESPYRSVTGPLLKYIDEEAKRHRDSITTVVLPEFVPRAWWQQLLHNQTALLIKGRLLFYADIVVTSVPHHLRR